MGVPALVAHLKQVGYADTTQRDLDLELYYRSVTPEAHRRLGEIYRESMDSIPKTIPLWRRIFVRSFGRLAMRGMIKYELRHLDHFNQFRESTHIGEQFPDEGLIRYRKTLNGILKLMSVFYYPYLSYPKFFSQREKKIFYKLHLWLGNLFDTSLKLGRQAIIDFYEDVLIPDLKEKQYDLIGISVLVERQFETAVLLAETIRKHGLKTKIVAGGSYLSEIFDAGQLDDEILGCFDYVVRYEGEDAMHKLLQAIEVDGPVDDVPNLVYLKDGERIENKRDRIRDIDIFATPDYDDLPLDKYVDRPLRLPVMGNRGCYWAKCTFCAHSWSLGVGKMRDRSADKLLGDIKTLQAKHGISSVFFADESIYMPTINALSDLILEEGIDISWSGMIRFEEEITLEVMQKMKAAGCYMLMFGLESISQHVQEIIKKGVDIDVVWRSLHDLKEAGIKVHLFMILGVPGETEEDMQANIDFMLQNTDLYETVQLAPFELIIGSPISKVPERYGIQNVHIRQSPHRRAYDQVEFERTEGLTNEEVGRYVAEIDANPELFKKDFWSGYGFRIFQPDRHKDKPRRLVSRAPKPRPVVVSAEEPQEKSSTGVA
jgi:radical SAM superfamily enzyme YgiQ (UPF0313 family)